jgi:hypothetical protein
MANKITGQLAVEFVRLMAEQGVIITDGATVQASVKDAPPVTVIVDLPNY